MSATRSSGDGLHATVLVVEDEPLIGMDYTDWLTAAGAEVVGPCAGVGEALELLKNERVDVAVLDYALTDGTSEPLQKVLEEKRVPFVVVTAYPRVLVRRADGDEVIYNKPMTAELLCAAVADALRSGDAAR